MKIKNILIAIALTAGFSSAASAAVTEGEDYEVLKKPVPQLHKDKIEVLEFFGYFCIHCKHLDPIIQKHAKAFPSDTYFRTEHVVWDAEVHTGLARLTAAVNKTGLKQQANPAIFSAIFDKKINLADIPTAKKWLAEQTSFDGKKIIAALDAFDNQTEAKKMADLTAEYGIDGTPTVIVGGKYKVIFKQNFDGSMQTIDELVQKVRDERQMKAPAPQKPAKSKGAGLVQQSLAR